VFVTRELWSCLRRRPSWHEEKPHPNDPPFLAATRSFPDMEDRRRRERITIHAFYDWNWRDAWISASECIRNAEHVQGWPCAPLSLIWRHKHGAVRIRAEQGLERAEKHERDLEILAPWAER
jgi:hypothetical protein